MSPVAAPPPAPFVLERAATPPPAGADAPGRSSVSGAPDAGRDAEGHATHVADTMAAIVSRTGAHAPEVRGIRGETAHPAATAYSVTIWIQDYRATLAGARMVAG